MATDETGEANADAVTGQRTVQTRILGVILASHATNRQHATDMLDTGGDGYWQHEQRSSPVDLRGFEVGQRQPGAFTMPSKLTWPMKTAET